ncbi:MAG: CDP-glycerol glycerophosphotransferase family protein [Cetobacterium sp.]|uniref:CDP-glycerol glycerophosphotransferase family protein n=1 Tax=Cetobacterium sp. TaxID=2071632 RepID=UPI003EE54189
MSNKSKVSLKFIRYIYILKHLIINFLIKIIYLLPIQNKVMFFSNMGQIYSCNPKYISEYLLGNLSTNIKIVWAFKNPENYKDLNINIVRMDSLRYIYELLTSKVIITNFRLHTKFEKKKGQKYIQTWHSSLRLKQIEKDAEKSLSKWHILQAKEDSKKIDYLLSGCKKSTEIFKRAFWYDGVILESGTPRNDFLFNITEKEREEIKNKLGVKENEKVLLYAPTFRKGNILDVYNLNYAELLESLKIRFGGKWKILLRLHPHLINLSSNIKDENILDLTKYDDIQELLGVSDFLISDYSSLIFDFSIIKKPCILYTPDLYEYTSNDRGLYFDIEKLPFESVLNNEALSEAILGFDEDDYRDRLDQFLEGVGSYEDGKASERVGNLIQKICKGE